MLGISNNTVVTIKFSSGEEVITKLIDSSSKHYVISKPLTMIMTVSEDSNQGMVAFSPWMLGFDETKTLSISSDHIVAITQARDDATSQYLKATND